MKKLYGNISEKTYKILAVIFCFLGDITLSKFIYDRFTNKESFEKGMTALMKVYEEQNITMPPDFRVQVYQLIVNALLLLLGLFILFHILNYTFFIFSKKFAYIYMKFLVYVATVGSFLSGLIVISGHYFYGTVFIVLSLLYLFVAIGLYYYPYKAPQIAATT
ncbi:MAG: hypothetical protein HOJ35_07460 [Bdellovibrionales bacterium]|jgi:hypothetical protein|nr:hypothetical protein [Bdellovibrionales bacterium]